MTFALVVLSCTTMLAIAGAVGIAVHARAEIAAAQAEAAAATAERDASGYAALVGHRVVASVVDGGSIRGVLIEVYVDAIVLAHPEWIGGARPANIGGEVTLSRSSVPMLQRFETERDVQAIGQAAA